MNDSDKDEIVFRYTRAMAIADGVLIDATLGDFAEVSRQHFPAIHLAMTDSVFSLIRRTVEAGGDYAGVWHDVLWMTQQGLVRLLGNGRLFKVGLRDGPALHWRELKILFHPGDQGEPCATVMLPEED